MPNRLINETSPYLLQHAHNPVDWHPWGDEALDKARSEEKLILVSIGYSSCHWCHVMERESYEDSAVARLMNEHFINIKVDREERPDLDNIFMDALQAMTGQGGWPLNIFLTPDGKPFFGGTYFPPQDQMGMPSWTRILHAVLEAYDNRKDEVGDVAQRLVDHVRESARQLAAAEPLTEEILLKAYAGLHEQYDPLHGGFGEAPKFPQPMTLELLLRYHLRTGDPDALGMVEQTLDGLGRGGTYDQIGGGFHRYSTDAEWLVPHFEKMLYDNALLARLCLHTYQVTHKGFYRRVAEETLDYVLREMTSPEGGFYSAQDADSEGEEGKFYVWTPAEIDAVLGEKDGAVIRRLFGVTEEGNFEGKNILTMASDLDGVVEGTGMSRDDLARLYQRARRVLREERAKRVPPATDDKVLTAWNGLMVRAFAEAGTVLQRPEYVEAARKAATFLLKDLLDGEDRVLRSYRAGKAKGKGYLEDYAQLADACLAVYEATFDVAWLRRARDLAVRMADLFWDEKDGVFYDTGTDHEALIFRPRETFDNAAPSGGSAASAVLLKLAVLADEPGFRDKAVSNMRAIQRLMTLAPSGAGNWLCALDMYLSPSREIVVIGPRGDARTEALLKEIHGRYRPTSIIAGCEPDHLSDVEDNPLFEGRDMVGGPTVYVCENYACLLPATTPEELRVQLEANGGGLRAL